MAGKKKAKKAEKRLAKEQKKLNKLAKGIIKGLKEEPGRWESDEVKLVKIENNLEAQERAYREGRVDAGGFRNPDFVYVPQVID